MKHSFLRMLTVLLLLPLVITGCGQSGGTSDQEENPSSAQVQGIPETGLNAEWPSDLVPPELPEYPSGTVTAAATDSDGVLTIKVKDTQESELDAYLEELKDAGWIVSSDSSEAEFGLHTVRFDLQRDGTLLQINIYTREAGSWPADKIPPDIPEPATGTLVGKVEILESTEDVWYFNYTYDDMDEAAAQEYMQLLTDQGWSGDGGQLYKSFEWKGKAYAADIELYETMETRSTFTCNFYLSQ